MSYTHLNINERSCIYQFKEIGMSVRKIAEALDRSPSTISRELKRNSNSTGEYSTSSRYNPAIAEEKYKKRRKQCHRSIAANSSEISYLEEKLLPKITMKKLRLKGRFSRSAETRGKFNDKGRSIKKRPKEVYKRNELGHWEGDTVVSGRNDRKTKSKYCFVTLAERKSRKYIAVLVPNRTASNVTPDIINTLKDFPDDMVKTITFDRGKEFSGYEEIESA